MNSLKKAALALALGGALAGTPITAQTSAGPGLRDRATHNLAAGGVEEAIEALAEALTELANFTTQLAMDVQAGFAVVTETFNLVFQTIGDVATVLGNAIAAHDNAMQQRVVALGQAIGNHDAAMVARVQALGQAIGDGISAHDMNMTDQHILLGEAIAAIQQQNLRLHIERNLGTGPDPTLNRIALFQLPQGVGGHLETVRGILADTIAKQQAANVPINPFVQTEINAGDLSFVTGNFKQAYDHYRTAYLGLASL